MKKIILVLITVVAIFTLDRITKNIIEKNFLPMEKRVVIKNFFDITYIRNTGVAFGMLSNSPPSVRTVILSITSIIALGFIIYLLIKTPSQNRFFLISLSIILGGATGNIFDRFVYGSVVDFLDFYILNYHWPAFNVADIAITVGVGLILLTTLFSNKKF